MKKVVVILLMFIYGTASVGATVHFHYCMNVYVGWSLLNNNDVQCGKCGMDKEEQESCCKDEYKHFKLKTEHQKAGQSLQHFNIISTPIIFNNNIFDIDKFYKPLEYQALLHSPPDITVARLHLRNCIFRI